MKKSIAAVVMALAMTSFSTTTQAAKPFKGRFGTCQWDLHKEWNGYKNENFKSGLGSPLRTFGGPDGIQSGIGIITGWVCDANEVTVVIDNDTNKTMKTQHGLTRPDVPYCDNSGFIALWNGSSIFGNWSTLGRGSHTLQVYADGELVSDQCFSVGSIEENYKSYHGGNGQEFIVKDFPWRGDTTTIIWNDRLQNFVVIDGDIIPAY